MDNPLISIIVPVYNSEEYLNRCIQSVIDQEYQNIEVLIIDDGSTDQSGKIIKQWAVNDKRIRFFHQENRGQSCARNTGLDEANGEYISFVDSDDYIASDYLTYLLSLFEGHNQCNFTACNHFIVRKKNIRPSSSETQNRVLSAKEAMENTLFHGFVDVSPWGKLFRKNVFENLRFPEGRVFEDTWLFGDVLARTEQFIYGHKCCYYYVVHEDSTVRKEFSLRNLQYIEAAKKLASDALKYGQDMQVGGIRRINHARLSVLRYMEHCCRKDRVTRKEIRKEILLDSSQYIHDNRTPKRDRLAVTLLRIGLRPFYLGWRLYSVIR